MPGRDYHLIFDQMLVSEGVICPERNTQTVHEQMDARAATLGPQHRILDPRHHPDAIRRWIDTQMISLGTIAPDTATDYVRVAWGHACLDCFASAYKDAIEVQGWKRPSDSGLSVEDWSLIFKGAWELFEEVGGPSKRYRPRRG